jgi:hypothetical protein
MPRKPRIQYPGAIYHLMSRGDRREDIFLDDVDRYDFLKTLAEACAKTLKQSCLSGVADDCENSGTSFLRFYRYLFSTQQTSMPMVGPNTHPQITKRQEDEL